MPTNLNIDDNLLLLALEVSGLKTKRDTVNQALREFIERRRQQDILSLFGKMDPDKGYDYKKARKR